MGRTGKYVIGLLLALVMLFSLSAVASADGAPDLSERTPIVVTDTSKGVYGQVYTSTGYGATPPSEDGYWTSVTSSIDSTAPVGTTVADTYLGVRLQGLHKDDILLFELGGSSDALSTHSLDFFDYSINISNNTYFSFNDLIQEVVDSGEYQTTEDAEYDIVAGLHNPDSAPVILLSRQESEAPITLKITVYRVSSQEPTYITAKNGEEEARNFNNVLDAIADSETNTETLITIPAGYSEQLVGEFLINSDSEVKVTEIVTNGNVTAKEVGVTSGADSWKVYVLTDGNTAGAFLEPTTTLNQASSSYVNVAKAMAHAVNENSIPISKSAIISTSLSLKKTAGGKELPVPDAVKAAVGTDTDTPAWEVHPELTVRYHPGGVSSSPPQSITYKVPNTELADGAKFPVSLTGLYDSYTYNVYHYTEAGVKETLKENVQPVNGTITVELSSFSWLFAQKQASAETTGNEVVFTYLQGDFGNFYEFTMQLKVPDDSYQPTLNLGGFRGLIPSDAASYAASDKVAYTVQSFAHGGSYYYTFKVKLFAKFLNTPLYVTVWHDGEKVEITKMATDTAGIMRTNVGGYGYSMTDYIKILNLTDSSYSAIANNMSTYANAMLSKFPDKSNN